MCGIVGIINFGDVDKEEERSKRETSIFLATELMQQTQARGKDATGVVNLYANGDWHGLKEGIDCIEFLSKWGETENDFGGFLKIWRKKKTAHKIFLGHCRKSSVGSTWHNANNHPIHIGDVVGVHNGTLDNHNQIFDKLKCKRDGDVDSEAIIRLLHVYSKNGTVPFTPDMIKEVAMRLQGSYAVLAFSGNNPFQLACFRDGRPIEFALIKPTKQILVASEKIFLQSAVFRMSKEVKLYNNRIYPYLTEDDVEFKTMRDDSLVIWDLTRDIDNNTKIEDLYNTKDVPRANKLWKAPIQSNYSSSYHGNYNHSYSNNNYNSHASAATNSMSNKNCSTNAKNYTSVSKKREKNATNKENRNGMIWNHKFKKFEPNITEISAAEKIGNVEINIDEDRIKHIGAKYDSLHTVELIEGDESIQDVTENIVEARIINEPNINDDVTIIDPADIDILHTEGECTTAITRVDHVVLEEANTALEELEKYESIEDVMIDMDIDSEEAMNQIPIHALANRMKKVMYKLGFYDGWLKCSSRKKGNGVENNTDKKHMSKLSRAEKNIRILKTMTTIMFKIFDGKESNVYTDQSYGSVLNKALMESLKDGGRLNTDDIDKVYSQGDMSKHLILRKIRATVKEKEK